VLVWGGDVADDGGPENSSRVWLCKVYEACMCAVASVCASMRSLFSCARVRAKREERLVVWGEQWGAAVGREGRLWRALT
jgi:hypothetical protein